MATAGGALSAQRRAAAGQLRVAAEACLADLAMAGSRFDVRIGWQLDAQVRRPPQGEEPSAKQPHPLCCGRTTELTRKTDRIASLRPRSLQSYQS